MSDIGHLETIIIRIEDEMFKNKKNPYLVEQMREQIRHKRIELQKLKRKQGVF